MSCGDHSNAKQHGNTGHDTPDKRSPRKGVRIIEVEKQVQKGLEEAAEWMHASECIELTEDDRKVSASAKDGALRPWSGRETYKEVVKCIAGRVPDRGKNKDFQKSIDAVEEEHSIRVPCAKWCTSGQTGNGSKEKYNGNTRWTRPRHTLPDG